MKIYLAASYLRYLEMQEVAEQLTKEGHIITSHWILGEQKDHGDEATPEQQYYLRQSWADMDYDDLLAANLVISFTGESATSRTRGGRHVEFGLALARGKRCWIVGQRENVFHYLPDVRQFNTFDEMLAALREVEKE